MPCEMKGKRKRLEIKDKILLVEASKAGKTRADLAKEYGIDPTTVTKILREEKKISWAQRVEDGTVITRKSCKKPLNKELDNELCDWVTQTTSRGVYLQKNAIKARALALAKEKNITGFTASNGWFGNFCKRKSVGIIKFAGEAQTVTQETIENWKPVLGQLIDKYDPYDIYNMDECALFYQQAPRKTYAVKGQHIKGHKFSKIKLTVLLGANMTGTHKLTPLVIGKSKTPRCLRPFILKNRRLPCIYRNNESAWMTCKIFTEYMKKINSKMIAMERKIIIILDNHVSHFVTSVKLTHVKLAYFPPNTTSVLQPLDAGVISDFKNKYRQELMNYAIERHQIDKNFVLEQNTITVLQAMQFTHKAWSRVEPSTIANCFRKAHFVKTVSETSEEPEVIFDDNQLEVLGQLMQQYAEEFSIEVSDTNSYLNLEDDCDLNHRHDSDELEEEGNDPTDDEIESIEPEPEPEPTLGRLFDAIHVIKSFCLHRDIEISLSIDEVNQLLHQERVKVQKQSKITDFFVLQ